MKIVIPMAGLGTRFQKEGITTPKPLIKVNGKTLIEHSVETLGLSGNYIFITRTYRDPEENRILSEILNRVAPGCREIRLDATTRGATDTCLAAREFIDSDEELVITNCDQHLRWRANDFQRAITQGVDALLVTYKSTNSKNSFALIDETTGNVRKVVEKQVVSDEALVGIHYWRRGRDFVSSALKQLGQRIEREAYISETLNFLIEGGSTVKTHRLGAKQFSPLGTPYDVSSFVGQQREYTTQKPKTILCDLDGTVLKHCHSFSEVHRQEPMLLRGVIEKVNEWDSLGHTIVFCTARKESARILTEQQLRGLGLTWDYLLMGLTSGARVIVNDKLTEDAPDRAVALNVITDEGFEDIDWESHGL